jgi:hypothetical protein
MSADHTLAFPLRVANTQDEFGKERFFVEDANGDWISDPLDSREEALTELDRLNTESR